MTNSQDSVERSEEEKAAKEWANERCPGQDETDIVWSMCVDDFLGGIEWERKRDKWTSVEQSLPESDQRVVFTTIHQQIYLGNYYREDVEGGWPNPTGWYQLLYHDRSIESVTHWMPIPELLKEPSK